MEKKITIIDGGSMETQMTNIEIVNQVYIKVHIVTNQLPMHGDLVFTQTSNKNWGIPITML